MNTKYLEVYPNKLQPRAYKLKTAYYKLQHIFNKRPRCSGSQASSQGAAKHTIVLWQAHTSASNRT